MTGLAVPSISVSVSVSLCMPGASSWQRGSAKRDVFEPAAALLCWYLNDELHASDPRLLTHQQWAIEEDPDHPTWQVVTGVEPAGSHTGNPSFSSLV